MSLVCCISEFDPNHPALVSLSYLRIARMATRFGPFGHVPISQPGLPKLTLRDEIGEELRAFSNNWAVGPPWSDDGLSERSRAMSNPGATVPTTS